VAVVLLSVSAATANPLLDSGFWKTATAADVTEAIKAGADVNAQNGVGATPLHEATIHSSNPGVIQALIEAGADVSARNAWGSTPLHLAAKYNSQPKIILALLEVGADPKAKDEDGMTPWRLAHNNDKLKGTKAYWELSNTWFAQMGITPLHWAVANATRSRGRAG
jgi:ankyrin repeat protein